MDRRTKTSLDIVDRVELEYENGFFDVSSGSGVFYSSQTAAAAKRR